MKVPMTTTAVARRLDRSEDTIRRWERDGRLPAVRTSGGLRLYDAEAVEQLAQRLERERRVR